MKLQLASYELSKLAKEIGFIDNKYKARYYKVFSGDVSYDTQSYIYRCCVDTKNMEYFFAPPLELLKKWFREKHGLDIHQYKWKDHAADVNDSSSYKTEVENNTFLAFDYDDALEAALIKACEIVKERLIKPNGTEL